MVAPPATFKPDVLSPAPTIFLISVKSATTYPVAQAKSFRVILDSPLFHPPNIQSIGEVHQLYI